MPIYEWHCPKCGQEQETLQEINDSAPLCIDDNEKMKKKISRSSFQLKGEGWYKDGYSKPVKSKPVKSKPERTIKDKSSCK